MRTLATVAATLFGLYLLLGLFSLASYAEVIGPVDLPFALGLLLGWPMFWAMALIFFLAAAGA